MTPTPYGPAPTRPTWPRTALRVLLAAELVLGGLAGAGLAALVAAFVASGCFIECVGNDGDDLAGSLLLLLAVGLLVAGPVLARVVWRCSDAALTVWAVLLLAGPVLLAATAGVLGSV